MIIARRAALVAAAALGLAACTDVTQEDPPASRVLASFKSPNVPAPADVALYGIPGLATTAATAAQRAQRDLLQQFAAAGGFPGDQEVPVTIPISSKTWNGTDYVDAATPPVIDLATVNDQTLLFVKLAGTTVTAVPYEKEFDPDDAADPYDVPLLRLRKPAVGGLRRWEAGARYIVAMRGGPNGVKLTGGTQIGPDTAVSVALLSKDKPLTAKDNLPLLGAGLSPGDIAGLEAVRTNLWNKIAWGPADCPASTGVTGKCWGYIPHPAPASTKTVAEVIDAVFPVEEVVSYATFQIAPAADGPFVQVDGGSGVVPLPIDLLRTDPDGTVITNPAFGPAAAGITTLDGFSTTAMMLAQPSGPVDASTINGANVLLYRVENGVATLVPELKALLGGGGNPLTAGYVAQPTQLVVPQSAACPIAGGCSEAIGLQPAVPAPVGAPVNSTFWLPPLRSNTTYAVIMTDRVKGVDGKTLKRNTFTKILAELTASPFLPAAPPAVPADRSLLSGVSADQARIIDGMRTALQPVWAALPAGTTKANVMSAYTFKTQTVPSVSLSLAAAPYGIEKAAAAAIFTPSAATEFTPPAGVPTTGVAKWLSVTFNSIDGIDKTTGAFRATLSTDLGGPGFQALLAPLTAYVAVPAAAAVTASCPAPAQALKCAPLVIFGHGLNGSKDTMFTVASGLAQAGFVVAAIDFPLHGVRNWCSANSDCDNAGADGVCTPFTGAAGQGDTLPPGTCTTGTTKVFSAPGVNIGSRYFVSSNFFRTRDAFRQNVLDQSALGLALSRPPAPLAPQPAANPFAAATIASGVAVDPTQIFYEGISLGSIAGTQVVATNPRITRASLSVGGGTVTDVFTNSPAFRPGVEVLFSTLLRPLLVALGFPDDPADDVVGFPKFKFDLINSANPPCPSPPTTTTGCFSAAVARQYLQTLNVAKWILDPGDPINYALYVKTAPLPNLLANPNGSVAQSPKAALGQIAKNDTVVPNPFNLLLYNVMSADQTFYDSGSAPGGSVAHSILASSAVVQGDAAGFLLGTVPPITRTLP